MIGIDVSKHNGRIDWQAVKSGGIGFAILRVGYTHYEGGLTVDDRFAENIEGALAAGIPVGVYAYAYDLSAGAARISAEKVLEVVAPYRLEYPVWYDQEYEAKLLALSKEQRTEICHAFLDAVQQRGYYAGLYASKDWLETKVDGAALSSYDKWVAAYRSDLPEPGSVKSGYAGSHGIWQYTVIGSAGTKGKDYWTVGSVPGVSGNCDLNVSYKDYPAIIRAAGLNRLDGTPDAGETITASRAEWETLKAKADKLDRIAAIVGI